jgi:precorrin-4 methylase
MNKAFKSMAVLAVVLAGVLSSPALAKLPAKVYLVGVGPAGPEYCTLQAINVIRQADVIYGPQFVLDKFAAYLRGKTIKVAWKNWDYKPGGDSYTRLQGRALGGFVQATRREAARLAAEFKSLVSRGKSVALLMNGSPVIFSDLRWLRPHLSANEMVVIPGLSPFSVGAAVLQRELAPSGRGFRSAVILYSPLGEEFGARPNTTDLAQHKTTMIFWMAGGRVKSLVQKLKTHYSGDTPAAALYYIGDRRRQRVVRTTLDNLAAQMARIRETEMVLIYVGPFLNR